MMSPDSHGAAELSYRPSRIARLLFLIAGCIGFLLLGVAQANALESTVADSVETDEVVENAGASEDPETVAEAEETTTAATTETAAEVEDTTKAATETVTEETAPDTVVQTTETAVGTEAAETKATVAETTEVVVEPAAAEVTKAVVETTEAVTTTVAETTESITEETAELTEPIVETPEELVTEAGLADTTDLVSVVVTDALAEAEGFAPETDPNESTSATATPLSTSDPEPRFDPGPAWPPLSASDRSVTPEVVSEGLAATTPTAHVQPPGPPSAGEIPIHLDPQGATAPDLFDTVWGPIARAGPSPDAAQSIVFLSAALLLIGLVRPRLADWLRLQPLIRRDDGLKLAIELPG